MAVTCGNCTGSLGRALGSVVQHETAAEVRDCYERKFAWEIQMGERKAEEVTFVIRQEVVDAVEAEEDAYRQAEAEAEQAAELRAERYWEEGPESFRAARWAEEQAERMRFG